MNKLVTTTEAGRGPAPESTGNPWGSMSLLAAAAFLLTAPAGCEEKAATAGDPNPPTPSAGPAGVDQKQIHSPVSAVEFFKQCASAPENKPENAAAIAAWLGKTVNMATGLKVYLLDTQEFGTASGGA